MSDDRDYWSALRMPPRLTEEVIEAKLAELTRKDERYLLEHPDAPWFYEAGFSYEQQPPGKELWQPIPILLAQRGMGIGIDCKDASCYRVAELRVRGDKYRDHRGYLRRTRPERAVAFWVDRRQEPDLKPGQYHVRVRREDGTVEDPSVLIGMFGPYQAQRFGATHRFTDPLR